MKYYFKKDNNHDTDYKISGFYKWMKIYHND